MSVESSKVDLGTAARSMKLLGKLGVGEREVQGTINDRVLRQSVAEAYLGNIDSGRMSSLDWAHREMAIGKQLADFGLPKFSPRQVGRAASVESRSIHDHFVPGGLNRQQLLEACRNAGIKLSDEYIQKVDYYGELIPTEACVFFVDYASFMSPTDSQYRPFMLDYEGQRNWAIERGGYGLSTVETTLFIAVLCPWLKFGYLPYREGSIRCANSSEDGTLCVNCDFTEGLSVYYWICPIKRRDIWALPDTSRTLTS